MPYDGKVIDLDRLAAGDNAEWNSLVNQYQRVLVRRVSRTIRDINSAEDITQTVFLNLWLGRSKLAHIDSLPGYLVRAVNNMTTTYLRKQTSRKESPLRVNVAELIPASGQSDPRVFSENKEVGQLISQAVSTFTPKQHQVVDHIRLDMDVSIRQIGRVMGCSHKNVRAIISRIRTKLGRADELARRYT